jgi:hypothetical protein
VHVHLNDARNALSLANTRFGRDRVAALASWAGGAAHLYTTRVLHARQEPALSRRVFLQWIGLPFVDEELFKSLLATLADVFPHVQVYAPPPDGSVLFLASDAPFDMEASTARALAATPSASPRSACARPRS